MNTPQVPNLFRLAGQIGALIVAAPVALGLVAAATGFQTAPKPKTFGEKVRDKFNTMKNGASHAMHAAGERINESGERFKQYTNLHAETCAQRREHAGHTFNEWRGRWADKFARNKSTSTNVTSRRNGHVSAEQIRAWQNDGEGIIDAETTDVNRPREIPDRASPAR